MNTSLHDQQTKYSTLIGLVERYSPTGQVDQVADWFVEHMKTLGFTKSFRDSFGNPVGMIGDGPNQMLFLGHIDTVTGEVPFSLNEEKLYGRGSVDAKGPLAAFADAVASIGSLNGWQLVVVGAIDEEGDSNAARFLIDQYQPQYVVIGEPSDWRRITIGYKGSLRASITHTQSLTHTASQTPTSCENVFSLWQKIVHWVASYNQGFNRPFEQVSPSLLAISSGLDGFNEWATLEISTRLPVHMSPHQWETHLRDIIGETQTTLSIAANPIPACLVSKNTPLVRAFLKAIRLKNAQPGFVVKTGTSDMNIVAPAWDCPILAYGPGDSSLDHTPNEHINLEDYDHAVATLQDVIKILTEGTT